MNTHRRTPHPSPSALTLGLACLLALNPTFLRAQSTENLSVIPKAVLNPTILIPFGEAAKNVGKSGVGTFVVDGPKLDFLPANSGSLVQFKGGEAASFDVFFTDTARLKAEADRLADIVKNEPADSRSVLFDLQKQFQASRTFKLTVPRDTFVFASALESSGTGMFQSRAKASPLDVNEAIVSTLEQASKSQRNWLDPKAVPFMKSYGVLGAAAKASPAAAQLAKSYEDVYSQFSKAIQNTTDQRVDRFVESAARFRRDLAANWSAIKDDPAARNAAAETYNGLARQRALKAQYGVLTNFPPLSYEQVFYFSRHVVTLKYAGKVICSGLALTKQWIISAGHCFSNLPWTDVSVVFDLDGLGTGSRPLSIIDQWPEPAPGSNAQDDIDFTFFRVEADATQGTLYDDLESLVKSKPYSAEPLCIQTAPLGYKQPVFAIGHPMGQAKTVHDYAYVWFPFKISTELYNQLGAETYAEAYKIEAALRRPSYADNVRKAFEAAYSKTTDEGGVVSRLYYTGAYRTASRPSFGIDTDTFAGDSGSPVFDRSTRCIVGIFSSGQRDTLAASETSWREHEVAIPISEILKRIRATDKNQTSGARVLTESLLAGREELLKRLKDVTNIR